MHTRNTFCISFRKLSLQLQFLSFFIEKDFGQGYCKDYLKNENALLLKGLSSYLAYISCSYSENQFISKWLATSVFEISQESHPLVKATSLQNGGTFVTIRVVWPRKIFWGWGPGSHFCVLHSHFVSAPRIWISFGMAWQLGFILDGLSLIVLFVVIWYWLHPNVTTINPKTFLLVTSSVS